MGVTAVVAVAAAVGAYQTYQSEKRAGEARRANTTALAEQKAAEGEYKQKQLNDQALEESMKASKIKKSNRTGTTYMGKGGTVLTGPQGIPGNNNPVGGGLKTVLGQ
jgi:Tfp pilus assembly protein PilE